MQCNECGGEQTPKQNGKGFRCIPCHKVYMRAYGSAHRKTNRQQGKCSKCGSEKPKGSVCKPCYNAWQRAHKPAKGTKSGVCRKCGGPSTREVPCKPCRNVYLREWNRKSGQPANAAQDEFSGKPYAAQRRYKLRHPDKVVAQRAAYKQKPEVKMASRLRANLSRAWNGGGYGNGVLEVTEFDVQRMIERQRGMCATCARTDRPLTIDHINPVSRGGTNALDNLQLLCRPCNTSKMTRIFSGIGYRLALLGLDVRPPMRISLTAVVATRRKRHSREAIITAL